MPRNEKKRLDLIEHFSVDHKLVLKELRRLESILEETSEGSDLKKTGKLMNTIKEEMNIHFRKEEEILFPVLNRYFERAIKKIGGNIRPEGPVKVMSLEHKALRTIIQNLEKALKNETRNEISGILTQFANLLRSHIFREENVLYIVADAKLKEEEKAKIAERILNLSKKGRNETFI